MTPSPWWTTVKSADLLELRRRLVFAIHSDFPALVEAEVEDVVQQAFITLFKRRDGVNSDDDGLFRYIKTVAKNNALDRIRTAKRRRGHAAAAAAARRRDTSSDGSPGVSGREAAEEADKILQVFRALDDLDRLVIWCHVVEGKSIRAVAGELNMNWHRVAGIVERALRKVRAELAR